MLHLPERIARKLLSMPESGMGYQVVDLVLAKGAVIEGVVVLNGEWVSGRKDVEVLDPDDIVDVRRAG
ncbi:MAG: hypothetical protein ACREER_09990 [Alphaproteobacteria bacterium]